MAKNFKGSVTVESDIFARRSVRVSDSLVGSFRVMQAGHGLSVGRAVYATGDMTFAHADASDPTKNAVAGIITKVIDGDFFDIAVPGALAQHPFPAAPAGTWLYLSADGSGLLTTTDTSVRVVYVVEDGAQGFIYPSQTSNDARSLMHMLLPEYLDGVVYTDDPVGLHKEVIQITDGNAAAATAFDLSLGSYAADNGDTYKFRFLLGGSGAPNKVVSFAYGDDTSASVVLVDVGASGAAIVAGGPADVGNVAMSGSVTSFDRGTNTAVQVDLVLTWTGASDANPVLSIKPAYNLDGTATEDVTQGGSITLLDMKAGAVAEFGSDATTYETVVETNGSTTVDGEDHNKVYLVNGFASNITFTIGADASSESTESASITVINANSPNNDMILFAADASLTGGLVGHPVPLKPGEAATIRYAADGLSAYVQKEERVAPNYLTNFIFTGTNDARLEPVDGAQYGDFGQAWNLRDASGSTRKVSNSLHFSPANGDKVAFILKTVKASATQDIQIAYIDGVNTATLAVDINAGTVSASAAANDVSIVSYSASVSVDDIVTITLLVELTAAPIGTPTIEIVPVFNTDGTGVEDAASLGNTTFLSFVAGDESLLSSSVTAVADWAALTAYEDNELVQMSHLTLKAEGGHTSLATFTAVEATNWIVISQNLITTWAPTTIYVKGERVYYNGNLYSCTGSSFTSGATFALGNFTLEAEFADLKDWAADTRYELGTIVKRDGMILRRAFDVVGFGVNESAWNDAEVVKWEILSQEGYASWAQNTSYPAGQKIMVNGEVFSRNANGSDAGASFHLHAADWTLVEDETIFEGYTERLLSGLKDAATGTGYRYRSAGYSEVTKGYSFLFTDEDAAAASVHEIALDTRTFENGDSYQLQLTLLESASANHVIEIGYSDASGNTTTKLANIGTGNVGSVAGGADAGNVTSVVSVSEVKRGGANNEVEVNLILSWTGASGTTPVLTLKPSYNAVGDAVEVVAEVLSATVVRAKAGAVADFPSASDITATKIDSSAAATEETLPAATGSGAVLLFANTDVTNTATAVPQAGETLNGIVDGTFYFSNHAVGTQFRATDIAVGIWALSVDGAYEASVNPSVVETTSATGTLTQLTGTTWSESTSTNPAAGAIVLNTTYTQYTEENGIRYYQARFYLDTDDPFTFEVDGAIDVGMVQGVGYSLGSGDFGNRMVFCNRSGVNEINVNRDDDTNVDIYVQVTFVAFMQPSSVVLAGMVEPMSLGKVETLADDEVAVAYDNFEVRASNTQQQFQIRYNDGASGTQAITDARCMYVQNDGGGGNAADRNITLTDSWTTVWQDGTLNLLLQGDMEELHFTANGVEYFVRGVVGNGYNDNRITLIRKAQQTVVSPADLTVETLGDYLAFDSVDLSVTTATNIDFGALSVAVDTTSGLVDIATVSDEILITKDRRVRIDIRVDSKRNDDSVGQESHTGFYYLRLDGVDVDEAEFGVYETYSGMSNSLVYNGAVTAGQKFTLHCTHGGTTEHRIDSLRLSVAEVSEHSVQYVNAEYTEATTLVNDTVITTTDETFTTAAWVNTTELFLTLPNIGKYRLDAVLNLRHSSGGSAFYARIADSSGTEIDNSTVGANTHTANSQQNIATSAIHTTTSVNEVVRVQVYGTASTTTLEGNTVDTQATSKFSYQQLPSAEYVTPGDVPVEDVEELVFSGLVAHGAATAFGSYADLDAIVAAGFEELKVSVGAIHSTAGINRDWETVSIKIADIEDNDRLPFSYDNTNQSALAITSGRSTFTPNLSGSYLAGGVEVRIYALKAQKTVINTTDVTVVDSPSTGYRDIGDTREYWGTGTVGTPVVFPAAFANATPDIQVTTLNSIDRFVSVSTRSATGFTAVSFNIQTHAASTGESFMWKAIGEKA